MELAIDEAGTVTLDDEVVEGPDTLRRILGDPTRVLRVPDAIPGLGEHPPPVDVSVWDSTGLIAGDGFVVVVLGESQLQEPVWPERPFDGTIQIGGGPLDVSSFEFDPLYEERFVLTKGRTRILALTDWRRVPFKLVLEL
jgi:hypothetical protein